MTATPLSHLGRPQPDRDGITSHDARALIPHGSQARVTLDGKSYWLRITRAGKLILTK